MVDDKLLYYLEIQCKNPYLFMSRRICCYLREEIRIQFDVIAMLRT